MKSRIYDRILLGEKTKIKCNGDNRTQNEAYGFCAIHAIKCTIFSHFSGPKTLFVSFHDPWVQLVQLRLNSIGIEIERYVGQN